MYTNYKTDGLGAIVSVIKNKGKPYLIIVNHDFTQFTNNYKMDFNISGK